MSDPNSFAASFADVIEAMEERVRNGVEQPAAFTVVFQAQVTNYELPRLAFAITRVTGLVKAAFVIFRQGVDYTLAANRLLWLNDSNRPDEGSRLTIEFTYREAPSGLTDFNQGSVIGTLIRAAAREMTLLYDQMDEAYRRAFINDANGKALDNVVALVGVVRNPAIKAEGAVVFSRKKKATQSAIIRAGTRVADASGRQFETLAEASIPAEAVEEFVGANGVAVQVANKIAEVSGVWLRSQDPATTPSLAFGPHFGDNGQTITLTAAPASANLRVRYIARSATVAVQAVDAGPDGNVNANTITIMPTPPAGVDNVTNPDPTDGGQDAEPDGQLRERAKHALERAGNATLGAIRFALLDVDGIEDVDVLDHSRDQSIALGEVHIRYSGGDPTEVRRVVEQTRAAGVIARVEEVRNVLISGTFLLVPAENPSAAAPSVFMAAVADAIGKLGIGEPLSVRKLNALAFQVPGLADVAETQLRSRKPDPANPTVFLSADVPETLLASSTELIRPDTAALQAVTLTAIKTPADRLSGTPPGCDIDIQISDRGGAPVAFRNFEIGLAVTIQATLTGRPDAPPERIRSFVRPLRFTATNTAILSITAADLSGLRAEHASLVEFQIAAAAYPGIAPASRTSQVRP
jgi:uncharacterized phage protein gp47/JayE